MMMLPQKEVEVKGKTYLLTAFGGKTGSKLYTRLMKLVGPAFMAMQGEGDVLEGKTASEMALEALLDASDKVDSDALFADLLTSATFGGKAIDVESHFAGNVGGYFMLVIEVIKFNFADVFTDLVTAVGSVVTGMAINNPQE